MIPSLGTPNGNWARPKGLAFFFLRLPRLDKKIEIERIELGKRPQSLPIEDGNLAVCPGEQVFPAQRLQGLVQMHNGNADHVRELDLR